MFDAFPISYQMHGCVCIRAWIQVELKVTCEKEKEAPPPQPAQADGGSGFLQTGLQQAASIKQKLHLICFIKLRRAVVRRWRSLPVTPNDCELFHTLLGTQFNRAMRCFSCVKSFMFYEGYNIDFKPSSTNVGGVCVCVISLLGCVEFSSEDAF